MKNKMNVQKTRTRDPYIDRRSGDDRRVVYDSDYFETDGIERRKERERRQPEERRHGCVRVSQWSSICPDDK